MGCSCNRVVSGPTAVLYIATQLFPKVLNWFEIRGRCWPFHSIDSMMGHVVIHNTCSMGSGVIILEDESIPVLLRHRDHMRSNDLSNIPPAVQIPLDYHCRCSLCSGYSSPNHDTATTESCYLLNTNISESFSWSSPQTLKRPSTLRRQNRD